MPIPTRSHSVRTKPTSNAASNDVQGQNGFDSASSGNIISASTGPGSGLPISSRRPVARSNVVGAAHGRSKSTALAGLPQPPAKPRTNHSQQTQFGSSHPQGDRHSRVGAARQLPQPSHARSQSYHSTVTQPSKTFQTPSKRQTPTVRAPFNTYQQHFSPQKPRQSEPITAKSGCPASQTDDPHIGRLQRELLQLSLVHDGSYRNLDQYRRSAQDNLDRSNARLKEEEANVLSLEQQRQEAVNLNAISDWLVQETPNGWSSTEKIRNLSFCASETSQLQQPGSAFGQLMDAFDGWINQARHTIQERDRVNEHKASTAGLPLVQPPRRAWLQSISAFDQRLRVCKSVLAALGEADQNSALGNFLSSEHQLVEYMLAEVEQCQHIADGVLADQQQWIASTVALTLKHTDDGKQIGTTLQVRKGMWCTEDQV